MELSLIIIGRNEGFKLEKCFESISKCKKELVSSFTFQTIYVDSNSSDESIEIAKTSSIDIIICIDGEINSAVARNVGAKKATSDWLLFLDGDMELHFDFFLDLTIRKYLDHEYFFSGQFINTFYNKSWEKIKEETFIPFDGIKTEPAPGGLFFMRKELWNSLDGMRNYYKKSQDFDLGLRSYKSGYPFSRINKLLATHHTIDYLDDSRILEFFKKGHFLYSRSLLYRDHVMLGFNKNAVKIMWRQDYTLVALFFSIGLIPFLSYYSILIYLLPVVLKTGKNINIGFFKYLVYILLRDVSVAIGMLTFYPAKKLKYHETVINM